jgi:hypothetical protein
MAIPAAAAVPERAARGGSAVPPLPALDSARVKNTRAALSPIALLRPVSRGAALPRTAPRCLAPLRILRVPRLARHLASSVRIALPGLLAALAVTLDAFNPAAQLYLARCGAAPFSFGNLVAHLAAFPCSSAAMLLLCFTSLPRVAPRAAMLRFALMAATMPAVCFLAAPLLGFLAPLPQAFAYAAAMLALPLLAEHCLPDTRA